MVERELQFDGGGKIGFLLEGLKTVRRIRTTYLPALKSCDPNLPSPSDVNSRG